MKFYNNIYVVVHVLVCFNFDGWSLASNDKLSVDHIGLLVSIKRNVFYIRYELIVTLSMYWIDLEVCLLWLFHF